LASFAKAGEGLREMAERAEREFGRRYAASARHARRRFGFFGRSG
jgi:hypothetical protein